MKKILSFVLLAAATCYAVSSFAQEETKYADLFKQEPVQSKWQHDSEYARWSVGVNFGLPFFAGDFKSLAYDETYWGIMADMQVGYQITPTIGTRLSFGYAQNKAGAYKHRDFLIGEDAYMIYGPKAPASAMASKDLYSKIRMWSVGFNIEINVNNLFSFPTRERRWTVLASPGIYLQKFNSKLYTMEGGNRFATKLWTPYGIGLGGDVALRFKASKCIDLQLRAGMNWINNSKFDGIESSTVHNHNTVSHVGIGMVWKIGARHHKKDALMYAYPRYRAPKPAQVPEAIVIVKEVKRDTIVINVPKQEAAPIVVSTPEAWPLPSVYFQRGSAEIDFDKYAVQLSTIINALKEMPDRKIAIKGYADKTGTDHINSELSQERADALQAYLEGHGIDASRIVSAQGFGVDQDLPGEEGFSVMARRAQVVNK